MDLFILIAQDCRMVSVGRHAADSEKDQGFEGTDILVRSPELFHIVVVVFAAGGCTDSAIRNQSRLLLFPSVDETLQSLVVKIYIGKGGKKAFHHNGGC